MLQIEHFSKFYGDFAAVSDLSLHIAPGEIYGFIGHNGAGKTTILHTLTGLVAPKSGTIVYEGKNIEENKRSIAYSLSFGKQDRTLTDEEVNDVMNKVIDNLQNKMGAELRG